MKNLFSQKMVLVTFSAFVVFLFSSTSVSTQNLDVAYVPTPHDVVERMLDMAGVGPGDYVVDLGCGDGRIVIAAAKRGAYGHGIDLDPQRIKEARKNAKKAGVADNVVFAEQNIYDTDFSKANVITMYLFPSINLKLRPFLLKNLKPGSRVVSHDFAMDEWKPDRQHGRMENHAVFLWIIPAQVEGNWIWEIAEEQYKMNISQKFQDVEINLLSGESTFDVENSLLSGKRISFTASDKLSGKKLVFSGQVEDDKIEGIVQIHAGENKSVENWTAFLE